mmetsp:Transcript_17186/g.65599  ORF Transcript_17186/g.65599 Transcript_17186/m.65599 type:complete len:440 (-) Transcript_17186:115-1434(-)
MHIAGVQAGVGDEPPSLVAQAAAVLQVPHRLPIAVAVHVDASLEDAIVLDQSEGQHVGTEDGTLRADGVTGCHGIRHEDDHLHDGERGQEDGKVARVQVAVLPLDVQVQPASQERRVGHGIEQIANGQRGANLVPHMEDRRVPAGARDPAPHFLAETEQHLKASVDVVVVVRIIHDVLHKHHRIDDHREHDGVHAHAPLHGNLSHRHLSNAAQVVRPVAKRLAVGGGAEAAQVRVAQHRSGHAPLGRHAPPRHHRRRSRPLARQLPPAGVLQRHADVALEDDVPRVGVPQQHLQAQAMRVLRPRLPQRPADPRVVLRHPLEGALPHAPQPHRALFADVIASAQRERRALGGLQSLSLFDLPEWVRLHALFPLLRGRRHDAPRLHRRRRRCRRGRRGRGRRRRRHRASPADEASKCSGALFRVLHLVAFRGLPRHRQLPG